MAETHPVELNEDGTVSLSVAGKPYMLRRPTFGELRRFREAQFAVEDDAAEDGRHKAKRLEAIRERLAELGTLTYDPETALWSDVPDAKITDDDETEVLDLGNEANKLRRESEFVHADEHHEREVRGRHLAVFERADGHEQHHPDRLDRVHDRRRGGVDVGTGPAGVARVARTEDPFSPWIFLDPGSERPLNLTGLPVVLAEFDPIYVGMGRHGWSPAEVDAMEVWQVARFLGEGEDDPDPVMRGARLIDKPKEDPRDPRTRRARDRKRPASSRGLSAVDRAKMYEARMNAGPQERE